jgi:hypothetical protein
LAGAPGTAPNAQPLRVVGRSAAALDECADNRDAFETLYWIIVHRDLRRSACVRAVIDWMKRLFAEQREVLAGVA